MLFEDGVAQTRRRAEGRLLQVLDSGTQVNETSKRGSVQHAEGIYDRKDSGIVLQPGLWIHPSNNASGRLPGT